MKEVVLVARHDDEFSERLRVNGCEVINLELIRTEPVENLNELDERLAQLDRYDGVFITSRNASEVFADGLRRIGMNFGGKVYVLGERSRAVIENAGLNAVFREAANTAEELINAFDTLEFAGKRYLFVRGNKAKRTVPEMLGGVAKIDEVEVYRTVDADIDEELFVDVREKLAGGEIEWVCFFSPSGVERFTELFDAGDTKIAVIGKTTGDAAKRAGLNLQLVSPRATSNDFVANLSGELPKSMA